MSARKKKTTIWQTILEINDISFKYYLGIFLLLWFLEIFWKGELIFKYLRFPLSWLLGFVVFSGLAKLFFNLDKLTAWVVKKNSFWQKKLSLKILSFLKKVKKNFPKIIQSAGSLFIPSLIFYLFLSLVNEARSIAALRKYLFFWKGPVEWFLTPKTNRMDWLLGFVALTAIVSIFTEKKTRASISKQKPKSKDYLFIVGLGIIGGILIFYKAQKLGWISYFISITAGLLIVLLSIIILNEDEYDKIQRRKNK